MDERKPITLRFPETLHFALKQLKPITRRSMTQDIRLALEAYCRKHGIDPDTGEALGARKRPRK